MSRRFALFSILILSASAAENPGITFDPYKHVIWIPVRINGGPPLTFGFDSAAARSAIDWDRAEEMKLQFTDLGERLNRGSG
ncbi:MAG: retropepsin-like domain-containing protein, partial [Acidobacteriia bacterium]|nr:retropepsin-like domain-containing protein [Terriglobia bacterium]